MVVVPAGHDVRRDRGQLVGDPVSDQASHRRSSVGAQHDAVRELDGDQSRSGRNLFRGPFRSFRLVHFAQILLLQRTTNE